MLITECFILMCNNWDPTTSRFWILQWQAGSSVVHSSGDLRHVGDAESLALSVLALSQSHPQSQQKPTNLERNMQQLSPKPGNGRTASQKDSVDPLLGFGFKIGRMQ